MVSVSLSRNKTFVILYEWQIFSLLISDELEQVTIFPSILEVSHFPILRKNFPQSQLIIKR